MKSWCSHNFCVALVLALAASMGAQNITGPVMGLVIDSNSLRPVLGIPGAAMLGRVVSVDPGLSIAAISPHHDYVLTLRPDDQSVLALGSSTPIGGTAGTQSIVLSPTGASAALQSANGWTIVTGLPDTPTIAWQTDASTASSVAISDDGKALLAIVDSSVLVISAHNGSRKLFDIGQPGGMAFIPHRTDMLIADASTNQVQFVKDVVNSALISPLADSTGGISGPVDVAGSEDGQKVFVANSGGVVVIELQTGTQTVVSCDCIPARLGRMSSASIFQLTDASPDGFWVFDGVSVNPRMVIVPPDPPVPTVSQ